MVRPQMTWYGTGKAIVTGIGVGTTAVIYIEVVREAAAGTAAGIAAGTSVGIEIEIAEIETMAGVSMTNRAQHL